MKKISLNEAQLRNMMCKWTSKGITKPKVDNLQNNLNESYSLNIFVTYSARTGDSCPSINFCFEFLERCRIFIKIGRRSHNLGTREEGFSESR